MSKDAFVLGWMLGSAFSIQHRNDRMAMDFPEALRRFDRYNEINGVPKGCIDPIFGIAEPDKEVIA